jgi:CRISPR/Cas system-associated endoribonuclease Cas2
MKKDRKKPVSWPEGKMFQLSPYNNMLSANLHMGKHRLDLSRRTRKIIDNTKDMIFLMRFNQEAYIPEA